MDLQTQLAKFLNALVSGTPTVPVGGSETPAAVSTVLHVSTTQTATGADTTETDLWTYSLPANTLNANGKGVRVTVFGTYAANGNTKTGKLYFGSTVVSTHSGTTNNATWWHAATILRTSATAQIAFNDARIGASNITQAKTEPAETLSGAVTIKFTGTNGSANANDIVFLGAIVETLN